MRAIVYDLLEMHVARGGRLRVLDAGCGGGTLVRRLQERHFAVGVDLFPVALRYARGRGAHELAGGSLDALPFVAESFDAALCLDVLYHIGLGDSRRALAELRRVLRPGGWLLVRQPAYAWLRGSHDGWLGTQRRMTIGQLRAELERAGFVVPRATYANTLLFPAAALWRLGQRYGLLEERVGEPAGDLIPPAAALNRFLTALLGLERRFLRWGNLPFGVSALALAQKPLDG